MSERRADREQIASFVDALFRYADPEGWVSLRSFFHDDRRPPARIRGVALAGGLERVIRQAVKQATEAANLGEPTVFAPPLCSFRSAKPASEANLLEGCCLSVECDARPDAARQMLTGILGRPTLVIASGGTWTDPETGEVQDKLHLHWRLREPTTTPEEHALLKRARTIAALLAESDKTACPMVHPLRWAGSWHTKAEPRLAQIIENNPAAEIDLDEALSELETVAHLRDVPLDDDKPRANGHDAAPSADDDLAALAAAIPNGNLSWHEWNTVGMALWAASQGSDAGCAAFESWSAKSPKCSHQGTASARWSHYAKHPPNKLGIGKLVYLAQQADPPFRLPSWDRPPGDHPADEFLGGLAGKGAEAAGDARFDLSHDGLALDMGRAWASDARHVALWGRWLFWTGARWEPDERLVHMTRTRDYLRSRADAMVRDAQAGKLDAWGNGDREKAISVAEALAKSLRTAPMVANVVGLARSNAELVASIDQWDSNRMTIGTKEERR